MIFQVTRTSDWANSTPPCEGCTLAHLSQDPLDDTIYTVEFNTLEELAKFTEKNGSIIIGKAFSHEEITPLHIEIYDEFRE